MGALGDIGSVLAYGLGTGANTRADELRKKSELVRQEGLARLKHDYARDNIKYQNALAVQRDKYQDTRVDKRWQQTEQNKADRLKDEYRLKTDLENLRYKHQRPSEAEKQYNFLKKHYGGKYADSIIKSQFNSGPKIDTVEIKRELDAIGKTGNPVSYAEFDRMVTEDPEFIKVNNAAREKASGHLFGLIGKTEFQPLDVREWGKKKYPTQYATATKGEQLTQMLIGGQQADRQPPGALGKPTTETRSKEIRSKEDLKSVLTVLEPLRGMELERALQEAKATFDEKSYKSILEALGLAPKSIWDKKLPTATLGDVAGALTRGVGRTAKGAINAADFYGKQLTASEKALLNLNNRVGGYITDRVKEAYLPEK